MIRIPAVLTGIATLFAAATSAVAQCPTDFSIYFQDRPDPLDTSSVVGGAFEFTAITRFDPDGAGPLAPIFIAALHYQGPSICADIFTTFHEWARIDRYDSATNTWVPMTNRIDGVVSCFATFDEDGAGPNPPRLYIGGQFSGWNGINSPNIMRYDGDSFSAVRSGLNGTVWAMHVHDDDATGPIQPKLYVGGSFDAAPASATQGQVNCGRLIRLTGGQRWENPNSGFNDAVFAICSYDEDGPGAGISRLVAGGAFTSNGGVTHNLISVWDGANWSTLSTGLDPADPGLGGPKRRVFALCEFDQDGTGPQLPSLFAGGTFFRSVAGAISDTVIRWQRNFSTGNASWLSVPTPPQFDGDRTIAVCISGCSNVPYSSTRPRTLCFLPFDIDGTGPAAPELYIGGDLRQYIYNVANHRWGLMKWSPATNSTSWVVGAGGAAFGNSPSLWSTDSGKNANAMIAVPGNASVPPVLLIAGGVTESNVSVCVRTFASAVTFVTGAVSAYSSGGSGPSVTNQPDNTWVTAPGTSAGFALTPSGTGPFSYQWRRNAADLTNGTSQGFGSVIGATGSATILGGTANPINTTTQGWYDCRVSNACGTGFSATAWLVYQPDATPYFPIRFDAAVAPVTTPIGNADMRFIFGAAPWPRFYTLVGGTPFAIAPTGNNAWRGELASGSPTGIRSVTIPTSRFGVGEVYTMVNTDGGSSTGVRFTFNATGGLSYTTTLTGGNSLRSYSTFFGPQTTTSVDTSNVFDNGLTRLDKQRILLPNSFRGQTLTSITIADLGTDSTGRAILAGLTLRQRPPACGPSDVAGADQVLGSDGVLSADDIIVFLGWFFGGDFRADVAGANQSTTPDGALTADDIIVFLGRYFAGC